ncbi:hypothetical protein NPIL_111961 [Nephila pilipes]|uniref:Uncharacterized protein n=1 Tax=Nephila pilipes TaxID=299642 RepID=A0A8X6NMQ1_NEPPI|nr:hypothetical protein NPIL_111961 [Nephila pilipes]
MGHEVMTSSLPLPVQPYRTDMAQVIAAGGGTLNSDPNPELITILITEKDQLLLRDWDAVGCCFAATSGGIPPPFVLPRAVTFRFRNCSGQQALGGVRHVESGTSAKNSVSRQDGAKFQTPIQVWIKDNRKALSGSGISSIFLLFSRLECDYGSDHVDFDVSG